MKYLIRNIRFPVTEQPDFRQAIYKISGIVPSHKEPIQLLRKALDTRKKNYPVYDYTLILETDRTIKENNNINIYIPPKKPSIQVHILKDKHPFIIGMGPAGLFCALAMVENGLKPILFDRGDALETRQILVNQFWNNASLDPNSNVQFGEGGAGAFSDGKLTARTKNWFSEKINGLLVKFGAPESIKWDALPHLGTDGIRNIVKNIREYLKKQGCIFYYRHLLENIYLKDNKVSEVVINGQKFRPEIVVLALGNAARETFRCLAKAGVIIEAKNFAIGIRITHPQQWINETIYGSPHWEALLGAASYRLTSSKSGKGTYTFCMCPGGYIISAASQPDSNVTNGMSYSIRNHKWGNSAIVTIVDATDYGNGVFSGMAMQEAIEKNAYIRGYAAPVQYAKDYLLDKISENINTEAFLFPSYKSYNINKLFTTTINTSLKKSLQYFDKILAGFIREGIIAAPETRTSSPIRILRDYQNCNCIGIDNLYAVGEGAGYAGGIISSAIDGYNIGTRFT